ncbi:DUF4238 domain-containing protein [Mesorhizobium sp. B2-3-14]|uniref:DUF4238 domain-containing protein n=1 Tax=unclassified Mesorhizobium TaxID=325217 RepID=UPI001127B6AD|nr:MULTISPECIES: DUF4238 domain-containing protein [unclassified Mesorhizobium]TPK72304.1 DUF4238 domain-containing protein [Mesorhizobium sp. B2-4-18]TPL79633.1 DUF4238 domain-containing protein [Mesorhizobium sp. B2-3-14]
MAEKANHHFIPQFYLRNFSVGCDKRKAKVFCYDQSTRKSFETLVRNVGSRRHFFRIDVEGYDPNHVEDGMAEIEGEISAHLAEVIKAKCFPSEAHFSSVMLLMGNVAVRNPRFRSMTEGFHRQMVNAIMKMMLQDKNRFNDSVKEARANGVPIRDDINYQDMKDFIDRGEYEVAIDQTYLIELELDAVPTAVEQLARRSWSFVSAAPGCTYATSDDPVILNWVDGRPTPYSPGFGVQNTIVMFTISPELALVGLFVKQPPQRDHGRDQVAALNTSIARYATKQLYARDGSFEVHTRTEHYVRGWDLGAALERQADGGG